MNYQKSNIGYFSNEEIRYLRVSDSGRQVDKAKRGLAGGGPFPSLRRAISTRIPQYGIVRIAVLTGLTGQIMPEAGQPYPVWLTFFSFRAWITIGVSLRFALAVGLHLRNEDSNAPPMKKESLVRVWRGLHAVENLLCGIIGRPCVIPDEQCTVPLPQVLLEEQSGNNVPPHLRDPMRTGSQGATFSRTLPSEKLSRRKSDEIARRSFLVACITIDLIMRKALSKLYSPRTATGSWKEVQKDIASLTSQLDEWAVAALPDGKFGTDDHDLCEVWCGLGKSDQLAREVR